MSRELVGKNQLVRCPRCMELLAEPQDAVGYKCGACGKALQAMKRRNKAMYPKPSSHETEAAPRSADNLVLEDKLVAKRRFVRCPRCENVLLEPQDAVAYECGGCCAVLRAPEPSSHETEAAPRSAVNLVSEDKEQSNPAQKAASSSSGECSLEENSRKNQQDNMECNGELENERNINTSLDLRIKDHEGSEKGNSTELDHCETETSSALMTENSVEEENIGKNEILAVVKEIIATCYLLYHKT